MRRGLPLAQVALGPGGLPAEKSCTCSGGWPWPTLHQVLGVEEAEAVHAVLQGPVAQHAQHELPNHHVAAIEHLPPMTIHHYLVGKGVQTGRSF